MDYPYGIEDLMEKSGIGKSAIYAFIKKNRDFFKDNSASIKDNSTTTKPKIKYNQVALDFLLSQYGKKESAESILSSDRQEVPSNLSENASKNDSAQEADQIHLEALQTKINALEAKIEALEKELSAKEEERKQLLNQNGALLLLLSQEKQEKALLLPAPKKSIGERIKGIFHKS